MPENSFKYVGKPRRLVEGQEKVTGRARYTEDLTLPGMLYAHPVLSPHAHARITSIDKQDAESVPGVHHVLVAEDLVTRDRVISGRNNAILAKERALWCGQPVAVVVADSLRAAQDGAERVFVEYEPLSAVVDVEEAIQPDAPTVWPDGLPDEEGDLTAVHGATHEGEQETHRLNNVHSERHEGRGDVAAGFAEADVVLENTFRMGMLHQSYMETNACVAAPDPVQGGITIYTSTQGQFIVRDDVARILSLPTQDVRVVPMTFGGGFGAKYGIIETLTAAIALTINRPVSLKLSRSDDFLTTTPAPRVVVELKTGAKRDGTLTALQARVLLDNGVFSFTLGGIVTTLLGGYYRWPNLQIDCYEVNTHKPQAGAYRAPGAPQATFPVESHMDEMARALDLDPLEFRLQNVVEEGDLTGAGRKWPNIGLKQCLERMRSHPMWQERSTQPNEGLGLAIGGWPSAVTPASAICRVDKDGTVKLHLGTVDISGVNSSFVLVAAETLGVAPEQVVIVPGNTDNSPFAPGSGGSQVTYSVSGAVRRAAEAAREKLLAVAGTEFEAAPEDIELNDGHAQVRGVPGRRIPISRLVEIAQGKRGGPGPIVGEGSVAVEENAPAFVAHLVRVKVDPATGKVWPTAYLAVQDVGFAINPLMVEGQIQGGIVQGIGMALHEEMVYDSQGQLLTGTFADYMPPRAGDVPPIEVILVENPSTYGPYGARGIAEPPVIPGGAAIGNAIRDATGVRLTELPMTPARVWQALRA